MKRQPFILFLLLVSLVFSTAAEAYWLWSPDIGKWINPKKAAKDTPEDQYAWAFEFYNKKDWDRAIEEFEKIPEAFPGSRLAAEGVYYSGLCRREKGDSAGAADAFQRLVDRYPYSDRIRDAIQHEFEIAEEFASGEKLKVLGVGVLSGKDKAIEIYQHIVKNAPFGSYGAEAQFAIGEVYKSQGEYEEAQKAYQAVVDEYPSSELAAKARYQIAYASMQVSKKSQYNEQHTQRAIEEFQGFQSTFPSNARVAEAGESIRALKEKKAGVNFQIAEFYERRGKYKSAKVYYQEVASKYPGTRLAEIAKKKANEMLQKETEPEKPKAGLSLWPFGKK